MILCIKEYKNFKHFPKCRRLVYEEVELAAPLHGMTSYARVELDDSLTVARFWKHDATELADFVYPLNAQVLE